MTDASLQLDEKTSPDKSATGLTKNNVDALRYDGQLDHPEEVAGVLHDLMPSGVRVLDVGCGTGSVTLIANRGRGNDVTCVEPDPERANLARSRGLNVRTGFLTDELVQQLGPFDIVMASDVLEHDPNPSELLTRMKSALKPGGHILISVPNVAHWSVRTALLFGQFDYEPCGIMDATHLRWFTQKTLLNLFAQCSLQPIAVRHAAGSDLPIYSRGIFRRIHWGLKTRAIRLAAKLFPLLFGVQHVVMAKLA